MKEGQNNPPAKAQLSAAATQRLQERYQHLKTKLLELGWIAQGSVMPQPPRAWRLTRKVHAKTVSVALSEQQAALYQQAIANQRKLESILRQMRELSKQVLLKSVPGVKKRRRQKHPKTSLS
ncbi:MAG: hypothetical protein H0U60_18510 [Blastocatellia bacterium]|nr:hypothetical protein [Blastocatellia bacterium]